MAALVPDPSELSFPALALPACRDFLLRSLQERWQMSAADAAGIDALVAQLGAQPVIVCLAVRHGNFPSLQYLAEGLRQQGRRTLGVYLLTAPPPATFDWSYDCSGSLARLCYLLSRLPRATVYVQAHGRWAYLGQFAQACGQELRVFQEIYDWMEMFVERQHEDTFIDAGWFSGAEIALIRHSELHARTRLAGFVYKDGGAPMQRLLATAAVPSCRMVPSPPGQWHRPPVDHAPAGPWHLVHAGQLKSASAPRAIVGDLQYLSVIHTLTRQRIEVSAFASAAADEEAFAHLFADYLEEDGRNELFHLRRHLPVRELIRTMHGQFHFGLLIYHFDDDLRVGADHLRSALASKLFTYLAAGLPVLVSEELEYMADIVTQHRCGLVLGREQIDGLSEILASVDYPAMLAAVAAAQCVFAAEKHVAPLLELLRGEGEGP